MTACPQSSCPFKATRNHQEKVTQYAQKAHKWREKAAKTALKGFSADQDKLAHRRNKAARYKHKAASQQLKAGEENSELKDAQETIAQNIQAKFRLRQRQTALRKAQRVQDDTPSQLLKPAIKKPSKQSLFPIPHARTLKPWAIEEYSPEADSMTYEEILPAPTTSRWKKAGYAGLAVGGAAGLAGLGFMLNQQFNPNATTAALDATNADLAAVAATEAATSGTLTALKGVVGDTTSGLIKTVADNREAANAAIALKADQDDLQTLSNTVGAAAVGDEKATGLFAADKALTTKLDTTTDALGKTQTDLETLSGVVGDQENGLIQTVANNKTASDSALALKANTSTVDTLTTKLAATTDALGTYNSTTGKLSPSDKGLIKDVVTAQTTADRASNALGTYTPGANGAAGTYKGDGVVTNIAKLKDEVGTPYDGADRGGTGLYAKIGYDTGTETSSTGVYKEMYSIRDRTNTKITDHETRLTGAEGTLSTLSGVVGDANTGLVQSVGLKANTADVTALSGRVGTAENTLTAIGRYDPNKNGESTGDFVAVRNYLNSAGNTAYAAATALGNYNVSTREITQREDGTGVLGTLASNRTRLAGAEGTLSTLSGRVGIAEETLSGQNTRLTKAEQNITDVGNTASFANANTNKLSSMVDNNTTGLGATRTALETLRAKTGFDTDGNLLTTGLAEDVRAARQTGNNAYNNAAIADKIARQASSGVDNLNTRVTNLNTTVGNSTTGLVKDVQAIGTYGPTGPGTGYFANVDARKASAPTPAPTSSTIVTAP